MSQMTQGIKDKSQHGDRSPLLDLHSGLVTDSGLYEGGSPSGNLPAN